MAPDVKLGPEFTAAKRAREIAEDIGFAAHSVARRRLDLRHAVEKLSWALFRAAQALAACGLEVDAIVDLARRGADHGGAATNDSHLQET